MIVYQTTADQFIQDCLSQGIGHKDISEIIAEKMIRHGITSFDESQKNAWRDSLPKMAEVLEGTNIDRQVDVAIEYKLSTSRDRIDFLLCGKDEEGKRNVVVVELKKWSDIQKSNLQYFVYANTHKTVWEDHWHPSYQAENYVNIIKTFNAYIQDNQIGMYACSYLHNMPEEKKFYLDDPNVFPLVKSSPAYLKGDARKLQSFLERYVRYPDKEKGGLLWEIDNSEIRPSDSLADSLDEALRGNDFFSYDEGQANAVATIVEEVRKAKYYHQKKTILIKGGPGSGKSVVALNAMGQLIGGNIQVKNGKRNRKEKMNVTYVTANATPKNLYKEELIQGNYQKSLLKELFRDPSAFVNSKENDFDCIMVDEAHRIYNHASGSHGIPNVGPNAIELLIKTSWVTVFFVDKDQMVTQYDYGTIDNIKKAAFRYHSEVVEGPRLMLQSEFRCLGGEEYISFVRGFLGYEGGNLGYQKNKKKYDFRIFDSAKDMEDEIKKKDREEQDRIQEKRRTIDIPSGKCRLVAGYCYEWKTKGENRDTPNYDINLDLETDKPFHAKWNLRYDPNGSEYSWLDDPESVEEVGCIHTCQGLDMPYCGVIIGKDLTYNPLTKELEFHPEANAKSDKISGIHSQKLSLETKEQLIRNTYFVLLTRGVKGTYVYCEDKPLREYLKSLLIEE